jgi:hypothetical protein
MLKLPYKKLSDFMTTEGIEKLAELNFFSDATAEEQKYYLL